MNKKSFNKKANMSALKHQSRVRKRPQTGCHYCGAPIYGELITKEHIKPQSKGGTDHPRNIVFSCKKCNTERGNSDYEEFKASKLAEKQGRRK